ncbi:16419_t:CDS:2 [Racocetra fulgida]|uniref:16419_t:CDS:1 n=1 Tax=Racocetra fulgida TaxID=60492 RepID=A0A9N8YX03_9GLOM|nr:16419_t:CDS:2 [Racocetra fulgida]
MDNPSETMNHTLAASDAIAKYIEDILEHWSIKSKVFLITSDSSASVSSKTKLSQEKATEVNLKLKPYIKILASSLTVWLERDAIENGKCLKSIMITENKWTAISDIIEVLKPFSDITNYISGSLYLIMSIIYLTMSSLHNSLLKEFLNVSIDTLDKIDLDITDN